MKGSLADFVMKNHNKRKTAPVTTSSAFVARRPKGGIGLQDVDIARLGRPRWANAWYAMLADKHNNPSVQIHEDFLVASKFQTWYESNIFDGGFMTNLLTPEPVPNRYGPDNTFFVPKVIIGMLTRNVKSGEVRGVTFKSRAKDNSVYSRWFDVSTGKFVLTLCTTPDEAHFMWAEHFIEHLNYLAVNIPNEKTVAAIERYTDAIAGFIERRERITIA